MTSGGGSTNATVTTAIDATDKVAIAMASPRRTRGPPGRWEMASMVVAATIRIGKANT
jgi:hypothetical protein